MDRIAGLFPLRVVLISATAVVYPSPLILLKWAIAPLSITLTSMTTMLAVALAVKYFSPAAALPGALFSIWHNLSGAMLAGFWSRTDRRK